MNEIKVRALQFRMETVCMKDFNTDLGEGECSWKEPYFIICTVSVRFGLQEKENYSSSLRLKS